MNEETGSERLNHLPDVSEPIVALSAIILANFIECLLFTKGFMGIISYKCHNLQYVHLLQVELCPPTKYAQVLIPGICECDLKK